MITKITKAYTTHYTDNGLTRGYVEWVDNDGKSGRTEGNVGRASRHPLNGHLKALFDRAKREGVKVEHQTW